MVPMEGGGFASLGVLCRECRGVLMEDAAKWARGEPVASFDQIDTGQKLPEQARAYEGCCDSCHRVGSVANSQVEVTHLGRGRVRPLCAECVADIANGIRITSNGHVLYIELKAGHFGRVGITA